MQIQVHRFVHRLWCAYCGENIQTGTIIGHYRAEHQMFYDLWMSLEATR